MATLPELVAVEISFELKGNTYTAKPLTLLEIAKSTADAERIAKNEGEAYASTWGVINLIKVALSKNYPEITMEYVAELVSGNSADTISDIINKIGGIDPKASTGETTSQPSPVTPAGPQET